MDTARIRRELRGSIRLLWASERWLWSGVIAVLTGFAIWVGATGAALSYGTDFAGVSLSVAPWTSTTTAVFGTVVVLWVLAPAAVVTYLVNDYVTNVSGNVQTHYRVEQPFALVAPVLALFVVLAGIAVALGTVPVALAGVLAAVGLLALVRTLAYSYRVFSFSVPLLVLVSLFVSLSVTAVSLLAGAGVVAGRSQFVEDAAAGAGDLLGVGLVDIVTGTTAVGPVTAPTLPALAALVPAGLAVVYLCVQSAVGLANRSREPDVPRSKLRTGQRYPEFARPTAETSRGGAVGRTPPSPADADGGGTSGSPGSPGSPPADASASPASDTARGVDGSQSADSSADETDEDTDADSDESDDGDSGEADDVSHTRVFTAPDDGDFDADVPNVDEVPDTDAGTDTAGEDSEETAVVGGAGSGPDESTGADDDATDSADTDGDGYRCPTCADTFGADTNFAYCPTCGTELEPE
jgi:hypothetical protein